MRRTKEDAALTRENILDAALQVFLQKGFAASTLENIAKAAGMTRGALYWHFKGKLDIYEQLYYRESQSNKAIHQILAKNTPPFEAVRKMMMAILERFYLDERFRQYIELTTLKIEGGIGTGTLNELKANVYNQLIENIGSKLEAAKRQGVVLNQVDSVLTARHLLTFVVGIYRLYFTAPEHFQNLESSKAMLGGYLDLMLVQKK